MTAADLFYYSASAGIWIFILILIFALYRLGQVTTSLNRKIEKMQTLTGFLNIISHILAPRKRGDRYE